MDFGWIMKEMSRGLEPLGKALEKEVERIKRFMEKLFSKQDFVENITDGIVFGSALLVRNEHSKKEYFERGIDTSKPDEILKAIVDKYDRRKDKDAKYNRIDIQTK